MPSKDSLPLRCRKFSSIVALSLLLVAAGGRERIIAQTADDRGAEPVVSLSAASITEILRREPGLLLQVKKLLVHKAYEQGRLLDPSDLTDEALFQLLREDDKIRVLATVEIENRQYVRAKPTRAEMEEGRIERLPAAELSKLAAGNTSSLAQSEEEKYWAQHERLEESQAAGGSCPSSGDEGFSGDELCKDNASNNSDDSEPASPGLRPSPPLTPRRRQSLAGVQPRNRDFPENPQVDGGALTCIGPEGLPGLLSASLDESGSGEQRADGMQAVSAPPYSPSNSGSPFGESPQAQLFPWQPGLSEVGSGLWNSRSDNHPQRRAQTDSAQRDHPVVRRRPNPYADVPSLYDLYEQVSGRFPTLHRFGEDIFRNGSGNFDELPMDLPVGPDYVLGPGDGLSIELWGGISQHLQRVVDREGRVALPEAGPVEVTGKSLAEVQQLMQSVLRGEFRDVHADVSLARLRTVRVYVVGDVQRPGAYDVSSLSTPLNAFYQAGGPTARGSLRILRHYRGELLVGEIDLYDLLLHGVRSKLERLRAGDTIMVPPPGAELTVEGMVRRPAIYELNHEHTLAEALELSGGVLNTGTLRHIEVERVVAHESRAMLRLDLPESNHQGEITSALENFKIQDGDKIRISPILPYSDRTVYLDGHVVHPGKHAFEEGMRISDLVHSWADLLPEPAEGHAEIIRLMPPDFAPQIIAFNLAEALGRKQDFPGGADEPARASAQNALLKPFDTVRIFGRYDFEDAPTVAITGEVRHPGKHVTNGRTRLRDAVYLAGGVTPDALLTDAQVFRRTDDGKLKVLSVNLERALSGNAEDNISLESSDRVFIHRNLSKDDPASVRIEGEVGRPGKYPLGEDMTAAQLVRLAGGLKRGAFSEAADLTRYTVAGGSQVVGEHLAVPIARALAGDADTDVRLHDGDVLTIRQLAGWNDVGSLITVKGEVMHPGEYGIEEGERLSSVVARAGGLRADAYPYGAIFERRQVRELEDRNRADLIRQVQGQQSTLKLIPEAGDADEKEARDAALQQWHATLTQLQNTPPEGRLVIHISKNVSKWANTPADIEVRPGDTVLIPKTPTYVMVNGQVYNPTAITYRPGKSAGWYLSQAGGPTNMANKKAVFVVRGDGSVTGGKGSGEWFAGNVLSVELRPGDMVFVPEKALGGTPAWKNTIQAAQLMTSVALAISVGRQF